MAEVIRPDIAAAVRVATHLSGLTRQQVLNQAVSLLNEERAIPLPRAKANKVLRAWRAKSVAEITAATDIPANVRTDIVGHIIRVEVAGTRRNADPKELGMTIADAYVLDELTQRCVSLAAKNAARRARYAERTR